MQKGLLHHVELNVHDLEKSMKLWGFLLPALGYEKYQEWEKGVSYRLGDTYLVFVQTSDEHLHKVFHRRQTGLNHLAFFAGSRAEVDALTQELVRRNVHLLYADRHPHAGGDEHYAAFFEDPDRIKFELVANA